MLQTRLCVGLVVALLSSTPLASDDCVDEQPNLEPTYEQFGKHYLQMKN